jgi:hypothetical protein
MSNMIGVDFLIYTNVNWQDPLTPFNFGEITI